ncbi:MAG: lipopolysaccharide kinase InaA family protein [Planctomycetota bacterium]
MRRLFEVRPAEHLRVMPGRETFLAELGAAGSCVVKRSHGAGWRERLRERWHGRAPRSAGRHEFEVLEAFARLSLRVPRALAWCEEADGRSLVVMERIEHTETLRERAARASASERRSLATDLLSSVLRLHRAGWIHRDLYLQHFLVRAHDGALVLIDVGRARHAESTGRRWLVKDMAALAHSTPTVVSVRERVRFLAAYLDGIGVMERVERRRFARDIEKKRALMAAHVPVSERAPSSRRVERRA